MMCNGIDEIDTNGYSDMWHKEIGELMNEMKEADLNREDLLKLAWRDDSIQVVAYKQLVE